MKIGLVHLGEYGGEVLVYNGRAGYQAYDMQELKRGEMALFETDELVKLELQTRGRGDGKKLGFCTVEVVKRKKAAPSG